MRVLMISLDRGLLGQTGSGDVVERHKQYADRAGHLDVIVPSPRPEEKVWSENLCVFGSASMKWSHFRKAAAIAKKLAAQNAYDLIITQDFAVPAGERVKKMLRQPWIVNVHGMFFEGAWLGVNPLKWYLYYRIRRAIRHADAFRVNNVTIQDKLRSWGITKPILVQPTPISLKNFSPSGRSPEGGQIKILYVGRLSSEKNVAMLIRAFKSVIASDSEAISLEIVGAGPEEKNLKTLASGDDRIKFLGMKPLEELPAIFQNAGIFVLPSNTESFGQVLLQAAASGCAIIATATAGAKSILGDSESGMLIPVGSQNALEEALKKLISTTFERQYWSSQAKILAEKYDGATGIEKTVQFWKEIAK